MLAVRRVEEAGQVRRRRVGQTGALDVLRAEGLRTAMAACTRLARNDSGLCHPGVDNSGVSGFFQFGANNSNSMLVRQYFGLALTVRARQLRPKDSQGVGLGVAVPERQPGGRPVLRPADPGTQLGSNELMMAGYYQAILTDSLSFQPTLTYIPNPGVRENLPGAIRC